MKLGNLELNDEELKILENSKNRITSQDHLKLTIYNTAKLTRKFAQARYNIVKEEGMGEDRIIWVIVLPKEYSFPHRSFKETFLGRKKNLIPLLKNRKETPEDYITRFVTNDGSKFGANRSFEDNTLTEIVLVSQGDVALLFERGDSIYETKQEYVTFFEEEGIEGFPKLESVSGIVDVHYAINSMIYTGWLFRQKEIQIELTHGAKKPDKLTFNR